MKKIQVLVANAPRLMRDVVLATIADQPDMEITDAVCEEAEILNAVDRTRPDFLIVGLGRSDERPPICDAVLLKHPEIRILAIAADRDSSIFYWISQEIRSSQIEPSEGGMLKALRGKLDLVGR
jgi:chemotaxis response regulator CheB